MLTWHCVSQLLGSLHASSGRAWGGCHCMLGCLPANTGDWTNAASWTGEYAAAAGADAGRRQLVAFWLSCREAGRWHHCWLCVTTLSPPRGVWPHNTVSSIQCKNGSLGVWPCLVSKVYGVVDRAEEQAVKEEHMLL